MKSFREREEELAEFLSELIQADTRNPPGNETRAARMIKERLESKGIDAQILEKRKNRGNLVARVKGKRDGPTLMLLSHSDVVPWEEEKWTKPPMEGKIIDGQVWGRGSIDCKGLTVMETIAFEELVQKYEDDLTGDLVLVVSADEEKGGDCGVDWLINEHWEKIECDFALNEGAGFTIPRGGKEIMTVQTSEKGILWLKIVVTGKSGHGSVPIEENALLKGSRLLQSLDEDKASIRITEDVGQFIRKVAEGSIGEKIGARLLTHPITASRAIKFLKGREPDLGAFIEAMMRDTITPTIARGGEKENVIPSKFEITLDCRLLPGSSKEDVIRHIKNQGIEFDCETLKYHEASESPKDTPLFDSIRRTTRKRKWCGKVVPLMLTGSTDSRLLRENGVSCYGFQPIRTETSVAELRRMIHGVDERISKRNLALGTGLLYEVAEDFLLSNHLR